MGRGTSSRKWSLEHTVTEIWRNTVVLVLIADATPLAWAVWDLVSVGDELKSFFNAVSDESPKSPQTSKSGAARASGVGEQNGSTKPLCAPTTPPQG